MKKSTSEKKWAFPTLNPLLDSSVLRAQALSYLRVGLRFLRSIKLKVKSSPLIPGALVLLLTFNFALSTFNSQPVAAAINEQMHFQGRLRNSSQAIVPDGDYNLRFKIYSGGDGALGTADETLEWTETYDSTNQVRVENGYFAVQLGELTSLSTVDFSQSTLWLSIDVGGTAGTPSWDGEMDPFIRLSATPYAFQASNSDTLDDYDSLDFARLDEAANFTAALQQSGSNVCTEAGNCSIGDGVGSGDAFIQGGNSFGATATLGTNDGYDLAFETNGAERMRIDATGQVGIGTTTPGAALDVQDGTGIVGQFSGRVVGADAVNIDEFATLGQLNNATADTTKVASLNTLTGGLTLQGTTGKVTVSDNGTDTITVDLHADVSLLGQTIEGSEITDDTITDADIAADTIGATELATGSVGSDEIASDSVQEVDLYATNAATDNYVLSYDSTSGGFTWVVDDTGTQLTETEVEAYIFDADNTGTLSSGTLALDSLSFSGTISDTYVDDALTVSSSGSVADGALTANVALLDRTSQTFTGDNTFSGALTANSTLTVQNATDSTTAYQFLDADGGNPILNIDSTNERVGIGTASPTNARLHVLNQSGSYYTAYLEQAGANDATVGINAQDAGQSSGLVYLNGGSPKYTLTLNGDETFTLWDSIRSRDALKIYGNGDLSLLPSSGNVGVGTASPSARFETDTDDGDNVTALEVSQGDITNNNVAVDIGNTGTGNSLQINTSDFVVDGAGNVGIGDASPAAMLTVGSGDLFQVNSSGQIAAAAGITSSGTITFSGLDCSANANGGALTADASGVISCSDDNGGTGSGTVDSVNTLTGALTLQGTTNEIEITDNGTDTLTVGLPSSVTIDTLTLTNALGVAQGGTGSTAVGLAGSVAYTDGSVYNFTGQGSSGQCLVSNGSSAPTWGNCSGSGAGAVTLQKAYDNGNIITTDAGGDLTFNLGSQSSTDYDFDINIQDGTTNSVNITRVDGTGTVDPTELLLLNNQDADRSVANGLTIQAAGGGITDGVDLSDADITNAINVGANTILGTNGVIDFTNFDVNSSGAVTSAGLTSSGTITFSALDCSANVNGGALTADASGVISCSDDDGGSGSGVDTIGTLDGGTASTDGASISSTTLYLQSASASYPGLVNTSAQTFAGSKTFSGALTANSTLTVQNATDSTTAYQFLDADGGNPILNIDSTNERVGIGDASPAAMLTVGSGDLFQVNSSGAIQAATGITSSGTITFSGLDCSANANGGALTANSSGVISCSDDNGGTSSGVDSVNTLTGALTLQGTANEIEITDNGTDTLTVGLPNDVTIGNNLTVTGNGIFNSNVSVGAGTSPGNLLSVGALTTADASGQLAVSTGSATSEGIIIQSVASQTADFLQAQDSSGNVLAAISADGSFRFKELSVAPGTPNTGFGQLYVMDDGKIYFKNDAGNAFDLTATGGGGSSTVTKKLVPEFAGGTLSADGTNNSGVMTADHVTGLASAEGYKHNYYEWKTDSTTSQDYDIVINYQLPSDFNATNEFNASSWKVWTYADSTADGSLAITVEDADLGTACVASESITPSTNQTWEQITLTTDPNTNCAFNPNDMITITVKMTSKYNSANKPVRLGEIQFTYDQ